ncbi:basic proline-rich protein [Apiospora aurea]|uniref:Basic proline-rich protein n=1 Tax=Apiospora aurea TaxID=335848 RepID=A0ABR1QDP0_9PEZI
MEPVPETESLEEFRPSPLPSLRLHHPAAISTKTYEFDSNPNSTRKPLALRRSNEPPSPSSPSWATPVTLALPYRPRTTSPLSGTHQRSKSTSLAPPSMSRTRSMPGLDGHGRVLSLPMLRSDSTSSSPNRVRPPRRKPADEMFPPTSPIRTSVLDSKDPPPASGHRRTPSPLNHPILPGTSSSVTSSYVSLPSTPSSVATSPSYRYDLNTGYSFPHLLILCPTIPDSPDAEEAALEDEKNTITKPRSGSEGSDGEDSALDGRGRSSLDVPSRGRTLGLNTRDKRKRWSVCGAERRGDIDLETIWED